MKILRTISAEAEVFEEVISVRLLDVRAIQIQREKCYSRPCGNTPFDLT